MDLWFGAELLFEAAKCSSVTMWKSSLFHKYLWNHEEKQENDCLVLLKNNTFLM